MVHQDNKPNNETFNSMGKPNPNRNLKKSEENQAEEFINETENVAPSTAQGGKQPKVVND